jgi:hypothetical protein
VQSAAPIGRYEALLVLALTALFFFQALLSMRLESLTGDEVTHLPSGYSYLATGRIELNPQHPPLLKLLAALPLRAFPLEPPSAFEAWQRRAEWDFGREFLFDNAVPPEPLVYWGRIAPILVGVVLLLGVWRWARDLYGPAAGLFALALCALAPDLIAHSRYVTTDAALAAFLVLSLWSYWRAAQSGRRSWAAGAGAALGLALGSKYLALVFVPLLPLLWLLQRWPLRGRKEWIEALLHAALLFGIAYLVATSLMFAPLDFRPYLHGMGRVFADRNPNFEAFLFGGYSRSGFKLYYPAALLVKLPLGVLALATLWVATRFLRRSLKRDELWLLGPIAVYFLSGAINTSNIGIRHVLGVEPLGFVLLGSLVQNGWLWLRWSALAALGAVALEVAWVSPYYLSFFNAAVGGPRRGIFYLDDSNIDWGQDAYRLRNYVRAHRRETFKVHYFGPVSLDRYGLRVGELSFDDVFLPQPGTTYVVSAHYLQRSSLSNDCFGVRYHWLQRYRPVEWIGGSLCVFRFSYVSDRRSATARTIALDPVAESARAEAEYLETLRRCPGWEPALRGLVRLGERGD